MNLKYSIFLLVALLIISATANAQHDKNKIKKIKSYPAQNAKISTDTLKPASFNAGTPALYEFIEGGYSFGVSKLSDRAYAQKYKVTTTYIVNGVALWIGAKKQIGAADTLNVILYQVKGPGTDTSGPVSNAPDTAYRISTITLDQIDTNGLTFVMFDSSIIVLDDYAVGVDFSLMNDDTLGLVTTTDGDALGTQLSWNKWNDGTWWSVLNTMNWGMDLDLGIFIIADFTTANINDNYFVDGIKLSQNQPNPASGSTLIQYEIKNEANVVMEIYDQNGRLVNSYNEGKQTAGLHHIQIDINKYSGGFYYYSLKADHHRLTKKMILLK
jgi:hypothetical protein